MIAEDDNYKLDKHFTALIFFEQEHNVSSYQYIVFYSFHLNFAF